MAKILKLPSAEIINGFKGTIDFYLWKRIPCVRKWPRSPGHKRAPLVEARWPAFAWAASNWNSLSPYIQDIYRAMAQSTNMSGRDLFVKGFIAPTVLKLE